MISNKNKTKSSLYLNLPHQQDSIYLNAIFVPLVVAISIVDKNFTGQNSKISTFFRDGGCIHLMKILEGGLNDSTCLQITSKIAYWSSSNLDDLLKNKLLQLLKIKLASDSNQVLYECLWILEICFSGETQCYDAAFRHVDITCEVMNLLQSEDEQISVQACFTICAYFKNANFQKQQQLCFSRIQKRMIQFLQMGNEYLNSKIMGAIMAILNFESQQGNHYISNFEKDDIRLILQTMDSGLANSIYEYCQIIFK